MLRPPRALKEQEENDYQDHIVLKSGAVGWLVLGG
jgi:hypothetical protein